MWGWGLHRHASGVEIRNPIALSLELEPDSSPVRGHLVRAGQEPQDFSGMLQLMALIERLHAHHTDTVDQENSR